MLVAVRVWLYSENYETVHKSKSLQSDRDFQIGLASDVFVFLLCPLMSCVRY